MKNKILLAGLILSMTACTEVQSPTPATQPVVTTDQNLKTLTLKTPAHVIAHKHGMPGSQITKVTVNTQTHVSTFYFDEAGTGAYPFQVTVKPKGNDVCIHNMKVMAHVVSEQIDCSSAQHCAPGNQITCAAVAHTLTTNGPIRKFLTQTDAICR